MTIRTPRRAPHPLDGARDAALVLIKKIAQRAVHLYAENDTRVELQDILLDLTCCHFSAQKLRLDELLDANDADFAHDIAGINRHLDRVNYTLKDGFSPRYSLRIEKVSA
jgi:hypothetical protein